MEREIRERLANREEDAEQQVIMKHKTMPIAVAMGFFTALGLAVVVGGSVGGVSAAAWSRKRRKRGVA